MLTALITLWKNECVITATEDTSKDGEMLFIETEDDDFSWYMTDSQFEKLHAEINRRWKEKHNSILQGGERQIETEPGVLV